MVGLRGENVETWIKIMDNWVKRFWHIRRRAHSGLHFPVNKHYGVETHIILSVKVSFTSSA